MSESAVEHRFRRTVGHVPPRPFGEMTSLTKRARFNRRNKKDAELLVVIKAIT